MTKQGNVTCQCSTLDHITSISYCINEQYSEQTWLLGVFWTLPLFHSEFTDLHQFCRMCQATQTHIQKRVLPQPDTKYNKWLCYVVKFENANGQYGPGKSILTLKSSKIVWKIIKCIQK